MKQDRKPSNLLKSIEYYQSKNVWLWFGKQQEAEVVRRIFDLFIDGKSSYDIVTILNAEGVPSPFRTRYLESMERRRAARFHLP